MLDPAVLFTSVSRDYPYNRTILWECLVDEDFLLAWLGETSIEDHEDGRVALMLRSGVDAGVVRLGVVTRLRLQDDMVWSFDDGSTIAFSLTSTGEDPLAEAISREAFGQTRLTVDCTRLADPATAPALTESWMDRLDALRDVLDGRPRVRD